MPNETYLTTKAHTILHLLEFSIANMVYNCLPGHRPVWRKSFHDKYGLFDESFYSAGDAEMWLRAVCLGSKFKKVPGVHTLAYMNPKGLSTDVDESKVQARNAETMRITRLHGDLHNKFISFDKTKNLNKQRIFLGLYNLGVEQMKQKNLNLAVEYFLMAYSVQTNRAEPLLEMAKIYREKGDVLLGYLLTKYALSHPCPNRISPSIIGSMIMPL